MLEKIYYFTEIKKAMFMFNTCVKLPCGTQDNSLNGITDPWHKLKIRFFFFFFGGGASCSTLKIFLGGIFHSKG